MSAVSVEFEDVGKRFGNRTVLAAVSGTLQRGRVLVVAGPNGAGKSTLLNILAGLLRPSRGEVVYREGSAPACPGALVRAARAWRRPTWRSTRS